MCARGMFLEIDLHISVNACGGQNLLCHSSGAARSFLFFTKNKFVFRYFEIMKVDFITKKLEFLLTQHLLQSPGAFY